RDFGYERQSRCHASRHNCRHRVEERGDSTEDSFTRIGHRTWAKAGDYMKRSREISVAIAIAGLAGVLAVAAPGYFARENLIDLFLANIPVLVVALGMTLVILTGQIDISVGSVFAAKHINH